MKNDTCTIEASTPHGRVKMFFPGSMTSEDREKFFDSMAKLEKGEKKPLDFGDFGLKKANESS